MDIRMNNGDVFNAGSLSLEALISLINQGVQFIEINRSTDEYLNMDKVTIINANEISSISLFFDHVDNTEVTDEEYDDTIDQLRAETYTAEEVKEDDRTFRLE